MNQNVESRRHEVDGVQVNDMPQRPWTSQGHASWAAGNRMGPTRPCWSPVGVVGNGVVDSFFIGSARDRSPEKLNRGEHLRQVPAASDKQVFCSFMYLLLACLP